MSQPNTPYHPIDTGDRHQDDQLVEHPGTYTGTTTPTTPTMPQDPPFSADGLNRDSVIDDGIVRPRFLGHVGGLDTRGSLGSFGVPSLADNDNTSSVYALNPLVVNRESSAGYSSVPYRDDPHDSDFVPSATASPSRGNRYLEEKRDTYAPPNNKSKRKIIIGAIAIGVIAVAIAIVLALYFTVIKKNGKTSSATGGSDGGGGDNNNHDNNTTTTPTSNIVKSGGDGSTITLDDGSQMTYSNKFGGTWYWDPENPFNNNAQAQSWTPPLNQSFKWGQDRIFGSVLQPSPPNSALILSLSQRQSRRLARHRTRKFSDHRNPAN